MTSPRTLISFDWALKKLLRNKANFVILEGFLSVLLKKEVKVIQILESESNTETEIQKFNRVDLLVEIQNTERVIIELQYDQEYDYFQRMLFASSKHISETTNIGQRYDKVKKVYSINLIYFDLGQGNDYVYYGRTEFIGIHNHEKLNLSAKQKTLFVRESIEEIYPEYYVIKINNFNDIAKDNLDEWIYYFKNSQVKDEFKAQGLTEVKEFLRIEGLSEKEKKAYQRHQENLSSEKSVLFTYRTEGFDEGIKEGIKVASQKAEKEKQELQKKAEQEKQELQKKAEQEKQELRKKAEQEKQELQKKAEQEKQELQKKHVEEKFKTAQILKSIGVLTNQQIADITGLSLEEVK